MKKHISSILIIALSITLIFGGLSIVSATNQLQDKTTIPTKQSGTIKYQYDEGTQRTMKDDNGKKTYYVNDMYEEDSDGTKRKYIYVNGMKIATTETKTGTTTDTTTYHHSDHLGGSNASTNENGDLTEVNDYYPYGSTRIEEAVNGYDNNYLYTGKELDRTSGLYYYGARYYDPELGRFTSVDPWGGNSDDPQSLNKYAYVTNNPMKYVDPDGKEKYDIVQGYGEGFIYTLKSQAEGAYGYGKALWNDPVDTVVSTGEALKDHAVETYNAGAELVNSFKEDSEKASYELVIGLKMEYDDLKNLPDNAKGRILGKGTLLTIEAGVTASASKAASKFVKGKPKAPIKTNPSNLKEQLTLEEAKAGAGKPTKKMTVKDPKYTDTHVKVEHIHKNPGGSRVNVHYWKEKATGILSRFKFKE